MVKTWVVLAIYLTIQSHKHKIKVEQVNSPLKKSPHQKNHKGIVNTVTNTKGSRGTCIKIKNANNNNVLMAVFNM